MFNMATGAGGGKQRPSDTKQPSKPSPGRRK